MGKWEMVKLGDVCSLITKGTTPTTLGYNFQEQGIGFVKIESLSADGTFLKEKFQYISRECNEKLKRSQLKERDILFSIAGALGRTAIVTEDILPANINQALALIRLDSDKIDLHFVVKALNSATVYEQFQRQKQGVAQLNLSLRNISDLQIPFPPLDEQKRMAKNLDLASEIVKGYKEQLAELDKLVQSVFYEMFGDPVTNEKGWEVRKLHEIFKVGSSKRIYQSEQTFIGVPFLRISNLVKLIETGKASPDLYISNEQYIMLKNKHLVPSPEDILVTTRGTLGLCYIVKPSDCFYFQDGMISWLHKNKNVVQSLYISNLFKTSGFRKQIDKIQTGTTVAYLSIAQLSQFDTMLPPLPLQTRFASAVTAIEAQKAQVQQALIEAENLFNSLMQEYFA